MTLHEMILAQHAKLQLLQTALGLTVCLIVLLFLALLMALAKLSRYERTFGPLDTDQEPNQ